MTFWKKKNEGGEEESTTISLPISSATAKKSPEPIRVETPHSQPQQQRQPQQPQARPQVSERPTVAQLISPITTEYAEKYTEKSAEKYVEKSIEKAAACPPEDLIAERHEKVRSALGPGTVIQGKLSFDTPVRIDGKLGGEVFSSRALIVGKSGRIDAKIEVASLIVYGVVTGSIRATEKIEIYEGGSVEGELSTPALMVESGARLSGECDMGSRSKVLPVTESAGQRHVNEGRPTETTVITEVPISLQSPYEPAYERSNADLQSEEQVRQEIEKANRVIPQ